VKLFPTRGSRPTTRDDAGFSRGGSYTATADQLILHCNTAQYRIRKAEELRGRPLRDGNLDFATRSARVPLAC
jgi:PucR C-terminal helix-turn-helix domain